MALVHDILLRSTANPFLGSGSINGMLLDAVTAAPNESLWIPVEHAKYMSVDVFGVSITSFSLQLYGTNIIDPLNQQTITIGGSVGTGHVLSTVFTNASLPNGAETVTYTTVGGDNTTTIATAVAAAINSDLNLAAIGLRATSSAAVVTVSYPSVPSSTASISQASPTFGNWTTISGSSTGSETQTVANGSNGNTIGSAITTSSITGISFNVRNIKARLTAISATSISAIVQGVF